MLCDVQTDFDRFITKFKTLELASISVSGIPEASYAPFILHHGCWYIYISALAEHTQNIIQAEQASILLLEPEISSSNLFARKRAHLLMQTQVVSRETEKYNAILSLFEQSFGDIVRLLRTLPDFSLIEMTPISGCFVRGFGQAFTLGGASMLHVIELKNPSSKAEGIQRA